MISYLSQWIMRRDHFCISLRRALALHLFMGLFLSGLVQAQESPPDPFATGVPLSSAVHQEDASLTGHIISDVRQAFCPEPEAVKPEKSEFAVLPLVYAKSDDIAQVFQSGQGSGLLSPEGQLSVDVRTNSLVVMDYPDVIEQVRQLVATLDVPIRQVEIEARIVIINQGELDELGVRWGLVNQTTTLPIGGSIEGSSTAGETGERINQQLSVNLPSGSGDASALAFQLAKLGSGTLLDLELSALQSESKAEVISSPRLLTTNRKTAYIEQGTEIPYQESNEDGKSSIAFKKAVLSLEVTPFLSDNDQLILELGVTQDRPGEVVKTGTGEAVAIITQRISTQVKVRNGETIVLGGIYQQSTINRRDKVPVLGDLPLVGALFRRDYQHSSKNELLIFVTPTLMFQ